MMGKILHPGKAELESLLKEHALVLVDFWATWCAPCRMLAPVIEQLAEKYDGKVVVAKVDIDEQQELAMDFSIQSIPTVILFKNGQPMNPLIGVRPAASYEQLIDENL